MSIVGVPMLLAPVFGPLIGGSLIGAASWRWIFFVNLPVGLIAIASAVRLLPTTAPRPTQRLDVRGVVLLPGGLALFLYGLPGFHGGIGQAAALAASSPHAADAIADAFAVSFAVALAITVLALVPALLLPGHPAAPGKSP